MIILSLLERGRRITALNALGICTGHLQVLGSNYVNGPFLLIVPINKHGQRKRRRSCKRVLLIDER